MVEGSSTSQVITICLCAANGSIKALSGSGISTMSDSAMPFHPAIEEPSNILPSSKVASSIVCAGKLTWCCTPRMSAKRRSTKATFSSFRVFRILSAAAMAEEPRRRGMLLLGKACAKLVESKISNLHQGFARNALFWCARSHHMCAGVAIRSAQLFRVVIPHDLADVGAQTPTCFRQPLHLGDVICTGACISVEIGRFVDELDHDGAAADGVRHHAGVAAEILVVLHRSPSMAVRFPNCRADVRPRAA